MTIEIRAVGPDRHDDAAAAIVAALGIAPNPAFVERIRALPELDVRFAAYDGDEPVAGIGSFTFEMTAPGGPVRTAGLTMVGTLATHRRQGILTRTMRKYLDEERARGSVISALWAAEGAIYGRYGYGVASHAYAIRAQRGHTMFHVPVVLDAKPRRVTDEAGLQLIPPIYDRVRTVTPGMLSRSPEWWRTRRLTDWDFRRAGGGELQRVVLERDGHAVAYALYRHSPKFEHGAIGGTLTVVEAVGDTPAATRQLWRYLFDVDLMEFVEASNLPTDHVLLTAMREPRRLVATLSDALWVRLVDLPRALAQRAYAAASELVLRVRDEFCTWNSGDWRIRAGANGAQVDRIDGASVAPDLTLEAKVLGGAYLGGVSFRAMQAAGLIEHSAPNAIERADAMFRSDASPWCPEIF